MKRGALVELRNWGRGGESFRPGFTTVNSALGRVCPRLTARRNPVYGTLFREQNRSLLVSTPEPLGNDRVSVKEM